MKNLVVLTIFFIQFYAFNVFAQNLDSLLIIAIKCNDLPKVKVWVEKGANVNCNYENKSRYQRYRVAFNPILLSSDRGLFEIAKFLLEKGADANTKDWFGNNALYYSKTYELTNLLIEKGAKANIKNKSGKTPLHFAKDLKIAQILYNNGADINAIDEYGETALHLSTNPGVTKFLIEKGINVNARDKYEKTALHLAKNTEIARLLIDNGADINALDEERKTPLLYADNIELVTLLLDKGANLQATDTLGNSLLHTCYNIDIIKLLIEKGANINTRNKDGNTPLINSSDYHGSYELVKFLIEKGANLNLQNNNGFTALHTAVTSSKLNIVRLLLEKGANPNLKATNFDNKGWTPAMFASNNEYLLDELKFLVKHKANLLVKNMKGKSALDIAKESGNTKGSEFLMNPRLDVYFYANWGTLNELKLKLEKNNFLIDKPDKTGNTLLNYAISNNNSDMVEYLLNKGADPNFVSIYMLDIAIGNNKNENLRKLFEKTKMEIPGPPLLMAVNANNFELVKLLVENGAGVDGTDIWGQSPLTAACRYAGNMEMIKYLVDKGANVNYIYQGGGPSLGYAVLRGDCEMLQYLIGMGADVNAIIPKYSYGFSDYRGKSILSYAMEQNNSKITSLLIQNGAK